MFIFYHSIDIVHVRSFSCALNRKKVVEGLAQHRQRDARHGCHVLDNKHPLYHYCYRLHEYIKLSNTLEHPEFTGLLNDNIIYKHGGPAHLEMNPLMLPYLLS